MNEIQLSGLRKQSKHEGFGLKTFSVKVFATSRDIQIPALKFLPPNTTDGRMDMNGYGELHMSIKILFVTYLDQTAQETPEAARRYQRRLLRMTSNSSALGRISWVGLVCA